MRVMKMFVPFLTLVAVVGCSSFSTNFDYDPAADFQDLKTYSWLEGPVPSRFELAHRRAVEIVNQVLAEHGYRKTTDNPDFGVAVHFSTQQKVQVTDWGYGYAGGARYRGRYGSYGAGRDIDVRQYTEGSLILDVVDSASKQLIWRGSATGTVSKSSTPEERTKRTREAVEALLAQFPPS